ncbi:MAG: serine hydrolase [Bacteroides sp.]|nr:serine hydrolase [Bacteroides sp.]
MKRRISLWLLAIGLIASLPVSAQINELPRSTPEEQGVPSKALVALFDSLHALPLTDMHAVVVMRHGKVIGEMYPKPYAPEYRHTMYSCSKTFVGVAVGLAVADNRLRVEDRVATFFPQLLPDTVSSELASMTVRHLLMMSSGVKPDWNMRSRGKEWIRTFLAKPVNKPGEYAYDSMVSYMLAAIVQKVTGKKLTEYLQEHVFTPMNVTEWAWEESPEGVNTGGWGVHIQPESLAKFGQLILNEGSWEGKQLVPAEWIREMCKKHKETGREVYGYHIWHCGGHDGAVRADGALGQYVISILDKDMVVVMTEATLGNGRDQRRLIWDVLLPEIKDEPLPANKKDYQKLLKKQEGYKLDEVQGKANSAFASNWENKTIELGKNTLGWESLRLNFGKNIVTMTVTEKDGKSYELPFGYKEWKTTSMEAYPPYSISPIDRFKGLEGPYYVSGSYAWISKEELQLKAHYVNWVSALEITFRLEENGEVKLNVQTNYIKKPYTINGKIK